MRDARTSLVAALVLAATLAACASSDPGVEQGRSAQQTVVTETTDSSSGSGPATTSGTQATTGTEPTSPQPTDTQPTDTASTDTASTDPASTGTETTGTGSTSSGVSGVGDVLFPDLGNPGIDVQHYDVDVTYDHATAKIDGTVVLTITATTELRAFTLDERRLDVTSVQVNGTDATYRADDPELRITPPHPIAKGDSFKVSVTYSTHGNPDAVSAGVTAGWFQTDDGSFVLDEPDGARFWLPSNDHPSDKATFHFTIHVPKGVTGVANGAMVSHDSTADGEVWVWDEDQPMTTYLIQLMTGHLDIVNSASPAGVRLVSAIQTGKQTVMQPFLDVTGQQLDYFAGFFGPYPFHSYGVAMTDGYIGGAMEEQTRSLFSSGDFSGGALDHETQLLLSHELTHQWFGDGVSPADWQDIWLNESFATYGEWMWLDHAGYGKLTAYAEQALGQRQGATMATGRPDVPGLFGFDVYEGGAVVLQALRDEVGDDAFFTILKTWVQSNLGESRTSADFIALSSKVAGKDLTTFFDDWLYATDLPDAFPS